MSGLESLIASYREMTSLAARVATSTSSASTYAQSRAVSLNMSEALAVVALLRLGRTRVPNLSSSVLAFGSSLRSHLRASRGLVAGLLAVVTKALTAQAHLGVMTDVAALVARTARERRHLASLLKRLLLTLHVSHAELLLLRLAVTISASSKMKRCSPRNNSYRGR